MISSTEKESLNIWVNGERVDATNEFADEGTEMHFYIKNEHPAVIKTTSSGNKKEGIIYILIVNGQVIPENYIM